MVDGQSNPGDDAPDTSTAGLRRFFAAVAVLHEPDPDPEHRFDFLGPRPSHSSESDEVWAYTNYMFGAEPKAALKLLTTLCKNAPTDDALCFLGVQMVEPLLDLHWKEIGAAFEAEARRTLSVRKAMSCALLDFKGRAGRDLERRLRAMLEPDDYIGRRPS